MEEYGLPATGSNAALRCSSPTRCAYATSEAGALLVFVMDGDAGLKQSFKTIFQPEVAAGPAHLAVVDFEKAMTNDMRNCVVADGRTDLCASTGLTPT